MAMDVDPTAGQGSAEEPAPGRKVILGLGNPGERYLETRHNVGFRVIDELVRRRGWTLTDGECRCRSVETAELILAMPQTFMNRSGYAARCLRERYDLAPSDFLIVYDEVHLALGTLRLRTKGSPAGHRGLESILENLGTGEVPRLRLGVGSETSPPSPEQLAEFVLADFEQDERGAVEEMIRRAADACDTWLGVGPEVAMQRWNGPAPSAG